MVPLLAAAVGGAIDVIIGAGFTGVMGVKGVDVEQAESTERVAKTWMTTRRRGKSPKAAGRTEPPRNSAAAIRKGPDLAENKQCTPSAKLKKGRLCSPNALDC